MLIDQISKRYEVISALKTGETHDTWQDYMINEAGLQLHRDSDNLRMCTLIAAQSYLEGDSRSSVRNAPGNGQEVRSHVFTFWLSKDG